MERSVKRYLSRHWQTQKKVSEMATKLGIDEAAVRRLAIRLKLGARPKPENLPADPSPEEIESRALAIRESWTPAERNQRWCGPKRKRWKPPVIQVGEIEAPTYSRM